MARLDLPARFYERRALLSDQVAACVLLDPTLCPSHDQLPRELVSCPNLRDVLRLSLLSFGKAENLVQPVFQELGEPYFRRLMDLLCEPRPGVQRAEAAWWWYIDYYVAQLRDAERLALAFDAELVRVRELYVAAKSEIFRVSDVLD